MRPPGTARRVHIGGMSRADLRDALAAQGVALNAAAQVLFDCEQFTTAAVAGVIDTLETTVAALGFDGGATWPDLLAAAHRLGLAPCPLETGPHLRLQILDQPEGAAGHPVTTGRAPPGALTVVSQPLSPAADFPRGFYLRRIDGTLWLRGFRCDDMHVWDAADRLLFLQRPGTPAA